MNDANKKQRSRGDEGRRQRPRGLGGVVLIMALLTALFVIVSRSGNEQQGSIYDFYRKLFNGQILQTTWAEGSVKVKYVGENNLTATMNVVLREFGERDAVLVRDLLALPPIDRTAYAKEGVRGFLADVQEGAVTVKRAFLVTETRGRSAAEGDDDASGAVNYLTAVVLQGQETRLVRVDPVLSDRSVTLQQLRAELVARNVPVEDRPLSRSRQTLHIEEPNTALIYFLGTIGPYLLVLAIVWFFLLRQMRAPGGGGDIPNCMEYNLRI